MFRQQNPDQVEPADDNTAGDRYENTNDKTEQTALLCPRRPSHDDFRNPVDAGDQKQNNLNQTALFVKPSHKKFLLDGL